MQELHYCKKWFRAKKIALDPLSETEARIRHSKDESYTVLVGDAESPTCFMEVASRSVGVDFLDDRLRLVLSYAFQELEPGRLFLSMATSREFDGVTNTVASGTTYFFQPSGDVKIRRERFIPDHLLETSDTEADVQTNWDNYPEFGDYASLGRAER